MRDGVNSKDGGESGARERGGEGKRRQSSRASTSLGDEGREGEEEEDAGRKSQSDECKCDQVKHGCCKCGCQSGNKERQNLRSKGRFVLRVICCCCCNLGPKRITQVPSSYPSSSVVENNVSDRSLHTHECIYNNKSDPVTGGGKEVSCISSNQLDREGSSSNLHDLYSEQLYYKPPDRNGVPGAQLTGVNDLTEVHKNINRVWISDAEYMNRLVDSVKATGPDNKINTGSSLHGDVYIGSPEKRLARELDVIMNRAQSVPHPLPPALPVTSSKNVITTGGGPSVSSTTTGRGVAGDDEEEDDDDDDVGDGDGDVSPPSPASLVTGGPSVNSPRESIICSTFNGTGGGGNGGKGVVFGVASGASTRAPGFASERIASQLNSVFRSNAFTRDLNRIASLDSSLPVGFISVGDRNDQESVKNFTDTSCTSTTASSHNNTTRTSATNSSTATSASTASTNSPMASSLINSMAILPGHPTDSYNQINRQRHSHNSHGHKQYINNGNRQSSDSSNSRINQMNSIFASNSSDHKKHKLALLRQRSLDQIHQQKHRQLTMLPVLFHEQVTRDETCCEEESHENELSFALATSTSTNCNFNSAVTMTTTSTTATGATVTTSSTSNRGKEQNNIPHSGDTTEEEILLNAPLSNFDKRRQHSLEPPSDLQGSSDQESLESEPYSPSPYFNIASRSDKVHFGY